MSTDARNVAGFYQGRTGSVVRRLLRERLALLWPDLRGLRVVGLGHAKPYLPLWQDEASSCIDARLGMSHRAWRPFGPSATVAAEGDTLPFPDLSVDRILLVHGLEVAPDARRLLRECWRVLRDDGALLVVAPNRVGLWAHVETTPFGQGQPYTQGQVAELLERGMFAVERRDHALFVPPVDLAPVLRTARLAERLGRSLAPRFAGVVIAEAVKDVYAAAPIQPVRRRRIVPAPSLSLVHAARDPAHDVMPPPRTTS